MASASSTIHTEHGQVGRRGTVASGGTVNKISEARDINFPSLSQLSGILCHRQPNPEQDLKGMKEKSQPCGDEKDGGWSIVSFVTQLTYSTDKDNPFLDRTCTTFPNVF